MRFLLLAAVTSIASVASAQTMDVPERRAAPSDPASYGPAVTAGYARVRAATQPFKKLEAAVAAGYEATVAICYADSVHGGMGYHHVNRAYMDRTLDLERPEILLYERRADGTYVLNGVEFILPYRDWPRDSTPPTLMGRTLRRSDERRYWYMHMWVWAENRAGLFADYNPAVQCRQPPA